MKPKSSEVRGETRWPFLPTWELRLAFKKRARHNRYVKRTGQQRTKLWSGVLRKMVDRSYALGEDRSAFYKHGRFPKQRA